MQYNRKLVTNSLLTLALGLLLAACSGPGVVNVAGTWDFDLVVEGAETLVLEVEQAGTTIEGTLSDAAESELYAIDGTVNAERIEFTASSADITGTVQFEGIVEGNSMEGWAIGRDETGTVTGSAAFTASRK